MYPISPNDPVNTALLMVAEDRIQGFRRYPFHAIAELSGIPAEEVMGRLLGMMNAGVVRRVRQTVLATKLAQGALVAWHIPEERLEQAFDWMKDNDPFTGHVVLRTTSPGTPGDRFRLWTTLKVPTGCGRLEDHCRLLQKYVGAEEFVLLPAQGVFALGVGHMRRRGLKPGDKTDEPAVMQETLPVSLSEEEWAVLLSVKDQLLPEEFVEDTWARRAALLGMSTEHYCRIAEVLDEKKVIGRFATFLEHVRSKSDDGPVTKFNGLFHWTVPQGMEQRAGAECGRHICMTHCYWRRGGEPFGGAQIMGVVHGLERDAVLEHKMAIDRHLESVGIPILHTAVFWGERSEIKPSEISPDVYRTWRKSFEK